MGKLQGRVTACACVVVGGVNAFLYVFTSTYFISLSSSLHSQLSYARSSPISRKKRKTQDALRDTELQGLKWECEDVFFISKHP